MTNRIKTDGSIKKPRVGWGDSFGRYDLETFLVGDRSGFEELRNHIDSLLEDDETVLIDDELLEADFDGLAFVETPDSEVEQKSDWFGIGCFALLAFGALLLGLGLWKLVELLI